MESLQAGSYEASHKQFKALSAFYFYWKRSAMDEAVATQNTKRSGAFYTFHSLYVGERGVTNSARKALRMDATVLAGFDTRSALLALSRWCSKSKKEKGAALKELRHDMAARERCGMLNDDGYRVFIRLLPFYFAECGYDLNIVRH